MLASLFTTLLASQRTWEGIRTRWRRRRRDCRNSRLLRSLQLGEVFPGSDPLTSLERIAKMTWVSFHDELMKDKLSGSLNASNKIPKLCDITRVMTHTTSKNMMNKTLVISQNCTKTSWAWVSLRCTIEIEFEKSKRREFPLIRTISRGRAFGRKVRI